MTTPRRCWLRGGSRQHNVLAMTVPFILLLAAGCDTRTSNPVSATSTSPSILLEDASLEVTGNRCLATGTVRNHTPDKTLIGVEVTAFDAQGSTVAIARDEGFTLERDGRAAPGSGLNAGPLRPGESGFFHYLLVGPQGGLRRCDGIARIELTGVTFR
jgi:hypothetical protein